MKHLYTWSGILVVVFVSVIGDILLARAMKQVGDVARLVATLRTVDGRRPHPRESEFLSRRGGHGGGLLQPAVLACRGAMSAS